MSHIYIILDSLEWNTRNIARVGAKYRTNKGRAYECDIWPQRVQYFWYFMKEGYPILLLLSILRRKLAKTNEKHNGEKDISLLQP